MNAYITADSIGTETGGGVVTRNELEALKELDSCDVFSRDNLGKTGPDPWCWDEWLSQQPLSDYKLVHFYSGTFTKTVKKLKENGCKVVYTVAAHCIETSKREHELLGFAYDYPHLMDPVLRAEYVGGYLSADAVVVPSEHSRKAMLYVGADPKRIVRIPHGVHLPTDVRPLPKRYTVGYLGAMGPDKGVKYLLQTWKQLNYKDAVLKIGGSHSNSAWARDLVRKFGGGNVELCGWVDNVSDFYNSLSLYVQPSMTEGFGIEVLEALAHGRAVVCSDGAGASDVLLTDYDPPGDVFEAGNVESLAGCIEEDRKGDFDRKSVFDSCLEVAQEHTWAKIKLQYQTLWTRVINERAGQRGA